MSVGRNELCPCGSGKKYKKCCGVVTPIDELRGLREQRLRKEYTMWIEKLRRFVGIHATDADVAQARAQIAQEVGLPEETLLSPEWAAHFYNWFVFDRKPVGGSLLDQFLATDGRKMETELQEGFRNLSFALYVLEEIQDDQVTVRELLGEGRHYVVDVKGVAPQPGQIIAGRLLSLGQRDLLFSGSMILPAQFQQALLDLATKSGGITAAALYRFVWQSETDAQRQASGLLRRTYKQPFSRDELRQRLEAHSSFVLKKQDDAEEIWVYTSSKQEHLLSALGNALLELHEVAGEVLLFEQTLAIEAFAEQADEIADALYCNELVEEQMIQTLTSTNSRLSKGTIFITSEPTLSPKLLQWAVQTYFAEKWLTSEQPELGGMEPILVAASEHADFKQQLEQVVSQMEKENQVGQGAGRYMRLDLLRPRLALLNPAVNIGNLLTRPLIEGLPESVYTVQPQQLADITSFVKEMTEGKSEATVKKYDEVMNLFRTFVRSAFGPRFNWEQLRQEELAYFLVHDCLNRSESISKTFAANLLSVLSAYFKWLDKRYQTVLTATMQPILAELKDTLPEAYRMRQLLQKEALANLYDTARKPVIVQEDVWVVQGKHADGADWIVRRKGGDELVLELDGNVAETLAPNWSMFAVIGQSADGIGHLYGTPELYPPVISKLLGADVTVLA